MRLLACLLLAAIPACGGEGSSGTAGETTASCASPPCTPAPVTCADGFEPHADGGGCVPILPEAECGAGERPAIGSTTCVPTGPKACPTGFVDDPSGWGCLAVLPPKACEGATIEQLGETSCQPIGDCSAPFPPSDATLFVDDDYDATQIDATHFATIGDALATATAGDVIAIEAGKYDGALPVDVAVSLVGRCPEQVIIQSADGSTLGMVLSAEGTKVQGLTVRGHTGGIGVAGATADIEDCVLEDNVTAGLVATDPGGVARARRTAIRHTTSNAAGNQAHGVLVQEGGRVELTDCVVAANEFTNVAVVASSALVNRTVVRDGFPQTKGVSGGLLGLGILAQDGADLVVTESAIFDNVANGVMVASGPGGKPATGRVERTSIWGTVLNEQTGEGRGLECSKGASLTVVDCTLYHNEEYDLISTESGKTRLESSVLRGAIPDDGSPSGVGAISSDGSSLEIVESAIVASKIVGVQVQNGGSLVLRDSLVADPKTAPGTQGGTGYAQGINIRPFSSIEIDGSTILRGRGASVLADGIGAPPGETTIVATAMLIADTATDDTNSFGRGLEVQDGAALTLTRCAVLRSHEVGVLIIDADTHATIADSVVQAVALNSAGELGLGLALLDDSETSVARCTFREAEGIGVAASTAPGFVASSFIAANRIGVHAQLGSTIVEADAPPGAPRVLGISRDTVFVGNESKIGSGEVPMPSAVIQPTP